MSVNLINDIKELNKSISKLVFSDKRQKENEFNKIIAKPFLSKGELKWQIEQHKNNQVFHKNMSLDEFTQWTLEVAIVNFKQANLASETCSIHYIINANGVAKRRVQENKTAKKVNLSHNKEKNYILAQGEKIQAFVDLGIFSKDYKIINSKYDKFKQINRFIEIIDDNFKKMNKDSITILDFGCGKSYLTFIVYYYFTYIKKVKTKVIGFDLKEDVVAYCNEVARKYGYDNLDFYVNDVKNDELYSKDVDMIITLHACDTATDYALHHAFKHGVKHIFSIPCCQHEINSSIKTGGDFDLLLKHGLIKERFSAMLTDSIRGEILEQCGYNVDMIEFVDFENSPKNLMIRATLKKKKTPDLKAVNFLEKKYNFKQCLCTLIENHG